MNTVVRIADMTSDIIHGNGAGARRGLRPLQLMRRFTDAARGAAIADAGLAFLAADIVVHVPDGSDLAGERLGKAFVRDQCRDGSRASPWRQRTSRDSSRGWLATSAWR